MCTAKTCVRSRPGTGGRGAGGPAGWCNSALVCRLIHVSQTAPPHAATAPQPADQVYTFERWNKHRSTARYTRHLVHFFSSRVFR